MRMDNKSVLFFILIIQISFLFSQDSAAVTNNENSLYVLHDNMQLKKKIL